jgi:hypothetical protein
VTFLMGHDSKMEMAGSRIVVNRGETMVGQGS